jgi:RNA polymerase sigma-70 factor, ECF subfamily
MTGWQQVVALYRLLRIQPSPVVRLDRALAIAEREGPEAGLTQIGGVGKGELANYYQAHSAPRGSLPQAGQAAEAGPVIERL